MASIRAKRRERQDALQKIAASTSYAMKKKVTFGAHENVTPAGLDGIELAYPFTVVDSDQVGSARENSSTEEHRVIVSIADTRRKGWKISDEDLPKVLFEYGREFIRGLIESDSLPSS